MIGTSISNYTILEKLGEGGMGVVYKARDTKLDRDVALKFLPAHLAGSEQDKARFVQEAKAAAALNHPNVCSIIDIQEHEVAGSSDKQMFIVMEYVDGQTLREMTAGQAKGTGAAISLKQAVDIGIQVADGLAAAHEKGIVHRDIKPENIMIRRDGIAQVMDFGLAKLRASGSKITRLTKQGSTVGTAGYMSPEQVTGQEADHRSDIFSLGVLLYELFTGELPFKGVHETALAYEIVNVDPAPMSVIRPALDPALDAIVLECLAKEKTERFQSVAEVAKELRKFKRESSRKSVSRITAVRSGSQVPAVMPPAGSGTYPAAASAEYTALSPAAGAGRRAILPWSVAAVLLVAAALLAWTHFTESGSPRPEIRLSFSGPPGVTIASSWGGSQAVSPDGLMIAFAGTDSNGLDGLYLRTLHDQTPRRLPGTDRAYYPFWSPDNRWIGFVADDKLRKIDILGGTPLTICESPGFRGAAWNASGMIVFNGVAGSGSLWAVSSEGGTPAHATKDTASPGISERWPWFLPDGDHFLFASAPAIVTAQGKIFVGSLTTGERKEITQARSNAQFADGHLFLWREGRIMAQQFDLDALELKGTPFVVASDVRYQSGMFKGDFSVSTGGTLVSSRGADTRQSEVVWIDRDGTVRPGPKIGGTIQDIRFSPDGKRLSVTEGDVASGGSFDIMVYDLVREVKGRLTFEDGGERFPVWSPDGQYIYYTSIQSGSVPAIFRKRANGVGSPERLDTTTVMQRTVTISPDGKFLFYRRQKPGDPGDALYALPLQGEKTPFPVIANDFDQDAMSISPDGRWIAYQSTEPGVPQIFVVPFPPTGSRWQVSSGDPSLYPLWDRTGKRIFYLTGDYMMGVDVETRAGVLTPGTPKRLFPVLIQLGSPMCYDISPDGKTFIATASTDGRSSNDIQLDVIMNWKRPGE